MPYTPKPSTGSSPINGKLIFDVKDGRLRLFPVVNADQELARLLAAFRDALITGDLWELVA
jgi:hypothetical protein